MDKESELSPTVQPFIPKFQRREGMESQDLPSASSPPLRLPNPFVSEQSTQGNQAAWSPRQRPSTTEGVRSERGDAAGKHGYSNNRHTRGTTEGNTTPRERSIGGKPIKMSKYTTDSPSHNKNMGKRSLDVPKRDFRGTRSAPNSAERPRSAQTESVTFEVKMADFPELGGVGPGNPAPPAQQKVGVCWGPAPPPPNTQTLKPEFTSKTFPARKGQRHEPNQSASDINPVLPVTPGHLTEAPSQTNGCGPAVTSWANVASQPPKKPAPKEKTATSTTTLKGEKSAQLEEEASEKKKRRKKKSKGAGEEAEAGDPVIHQEPPKFEDEDEFPDLAFAFAGTPRLLTSSNTAKLCNEESHKEGTQPQSTDHSKDKASAGKPPPVETAKKGQKSEKASGKKSKAPVQLDIGNMLAVLEKRQQSQKTKHDAKPVILSVGGALPVGHKQPVTQKKPPWQQEKIAHNPLDSTSPLVKKGKQREVPKAKKPTPLKRVILKEREERKQNRLLEERGLPPEGESQPANDNTEEEQCETNSTDDRGSPTVGLEDQPEGDEISETEGEGEEREKEEEEPEEQQQTTQTLPCLPSRPKIHSRKFRDYCSQVLSKDVDECVTALLKELVRFQDRLYQKDPMKARMRRRLVMGLREVLKHLKLHKVKCVVISPNCERIQSKGGLDEALHNIIDTCREQGVPFVFALSRKALGRCVNKAVPVSLVGIFNYDGAQDYYHKMIELSAEARRAYEVMVANLELAGPAEAGQEGNPEQEPSTEPQPGPDTTQPEEPEYIKLWKRMLERECNHKFLNFEEQLSSMQLASECTEQTDEEERS